MEIAELRVKKTAMASTSRSQVSERTDLTLVNRRRRTQPQRPDPRSRRLGSTAVALMLLGVVLWFLPPKSAKVSAKLSADAIQALPTDLRLSGVQISQPPAGDALYIDGLVTNTGSARVVGATAEVQFRDAKGNIVATMHKPMVGMAHGGTDVIGNELTRHPLKPNEMRFFRVAVDEIPPAWNHEIPELKVVDTKAR